MSDSASLPPNYFLAGLLDEKTSRHVTKYRLKGHLPEIQRNTKVENLHITIGYIGPIIQEDLGRIIKVYQSIDLPPAMPAKLTGLGLYGGSNNNKKYFGITVEDGAHMLKDLRDHTDELLGKNTEYDYMKNHWPNFKPHITIQRLKKNLPFEEMKKIQKVFMNQEFIPYSFFIQKIALWFKNHQTGYYESRWEKSLK